MTNNHLEIVMPKLGLTMTEGTITEWRKAEGETVKQGEILFEFESEKSALEFEAPADGVLAEIITSAGETVPCGTAVARLTTALPTADPFDKLRAGRRPIRQACAERSRSTQGEPPTADQSLPATPAAKRLARELNVDLSALSGRGPQGRIQMADVEVAAESAAIPATEPAKTATPVAKRLAAELNLDWTQLKGSGPGGRVVKADVQQADRPQAAPVSLPDTEAGAPVSVEPLSGVRRVIAQRMSASAFTAPHVTLFTEADATNLVEARTQINAELAGMVKVSYNALLVAISARALNDYPNLNACLVDEEIHRYHNIHIALAVDTERGLLVPVFRHADQRDLVSIQQSGDELIQRALSGQSLPDDLSGGTFTITNLGMLDIDGFTPIINQPQAAILGVGRIVPKPVVVDNNIVIRQMMSLSLSFDHRLVDGGPAARFLQRIKQLIERPFALLVQNKIVNNE
jgi:pyruvate dehydrogenase E2 component (dihydrolipoamide acetyltransferase)